MGLLFGASTVCLVLLPIMISYQMQLMVCAVLAKRYSAGKTAAKVVRGAAE
jgi:sodium/bile acid cotransporter 7